MATLKGVTLTLLIGPIAVAPAPAAVVDALETAQVTTAVGQRSGFQLTFAYSKSSPIATTLLPTGYFDPLIRVILVATLNGVPTVLADGPILRQDVAASSKPGESRLVITGQDVSGYMDLIPLDGMPYPAMPSFARVALMLAKYALFGVIPVPIPAPFEALPLPTEKTPSQQGTDYEYINKLAKDASYEFYVTPGPAPGTNTAYWGPQVRVGIPQPALTIDMDHASNIEKISFSADGTAAELPIGFVKVAGISIPVPGARYRAVEPATKRPADDPAQAADARDRTAEAAGRAGRVAGRAQPRRPGNRVRAALDVVTYGQPLGRPRDSRQCTAGPGWPMTGSGM